MYKKIMKGRFGAGAVRLLTLSVFILGTEAWAIDIPSPPAGGPPAPVLTGIEISGPASMDEDGAAEFSCTAKYSDLSSAIITPVWSVDADFAAINSSGTLTSDDLIEDQTVTVTAIYDGETASLEITVIDSVPTLTGLTIQGPAQIYEQANATFTCNGSYSDGSSRTVDADWSVSSSAAVIDSAGRLTAGDVSSDSQMLVYAAFGGKSANVALTIKYIPPELVGIMIAGGVSVSEGSSIDLSCVAQFSDGSSSIVEPVWSVNSPYASLSSTGVLTGGNVLSDQAVTVGASYGGFADTHSVLITYVAPALESISIAGPTSIFEESSAQYACTAYYSDGTQKTVSPSWKESSSYISVSGGGLVSTGDVTEDRSARLSASYGGKTAQLNISVLYVEPDLESIVVSGAVIVDEGVSTRYTCIGYYADGTSGTVVPVWSVNSSNAVIGADGWLTAGNVLEDEGIIVTANVGNLSDSIAVSIKFVPPPVVVTGIWIEGTNTMWELDDAELICMASFSDGTTNTVSASWSVASGNASISSGILSAGNVEEDSLLSVTASYAGFQAGHEMNVRYVDTTITYPLIDLEGKTVMATVYEQTADQWYTVGPFEEEIIFERKDPTQWYWISIYETNTVSGESTEIQAGWMHL
ncbi:hypothetical protein [Pontiella agarivorans]|uniref:Ig-like domain-containing protein n=1 Tax=Pontiella agarivorans TaxID=3038953 RepID=A0ABU5MUY6_9BACT|nr:hypothetical protein [Pontiella agarivorans]MDZ8117761.1 hypothetical protein [Pontiella agarivorans]